MLRSLVVVGALTMAGTAYAQDFTTLADVVTDKANDLRGLAYGRDGKIYVSGHRGDVAKETVVVVGRFNADGTPDTGFGSGGFAEVDLGPGKIEQSLGVVALANGDVVAALNANEDGGGVSVYLVRFDPKGVRKTGAAWGGETGAVEVVFGWPNARNDGFPNVSSAPQDTAWDLKLDNSGGQEKLVVAGHGSAPEGSGRTDVDRYVARLMASDGKPDPAFNGGKPFTYHSAQNFAEGGRRLIVEPDGSILSSGYSTLGNLKNNVVLIRLDPNGKPDAGFGGFVSPTSSAAAVGLTPAPGIAVFNPFVGDGGFAECYATVKLSDGSYVTTGYGAATGDGTASKLGFKTTQGPDIVSFRVAGKALDTKWGQGGNVAIQSEGAGKPTAEDRGRLLVALPKDRTLHVGLYGGIPAAVVLDAQGKLDTTVSGDGIIELPGTKVTTQFFGAAVSADGKRVALTTTSHKDGARLVILEAKD
jgi:uncharacterized delta-60 repeat protein